MWLTETLKTAIKIYYFFLAPNWGFGEQSWELRIWRERLLTTKIPNTHGVASNYPPHPTLPTPTQTLHRNNQTPKNTIKTRPFVAGGPTIKIYTNSISYITNYKSPQEAYIGNVKIIFVVYSNCIPGVSWKRIPSVLPGSPYKPSGLPWGWLKHSWKGCLFATFPILLLQSPQIPGPKKYVVD